MNSTRSVPALCRLFLSLLAVAAVLTTTAGAASAGGGAASTTNVMIGGTATIPFTNPCTGGSGTAQVTFNAVFHQTDRPVDTLNELNNIAGEFVLTLDSGDVITGHFASVFVIGGGENLTLVTPLNATGVASDGSRFTLHFLVVEAENALGVTIVDLEMCA
jgi:hypothetical protein